MQDDIDSFEFHGHRVEVTVVHHSDGWHWAYRVDGGPRERMYTLPAYSAHRAYEDAGIAARDQIRATRCRGDNHRAPSWELNVAAGRLPALDEEDSAYGPLLPPWGSQYAAEAASSARMGARAP